MEENKMDLSLNEIRQGQMMGDFSPEDFNKVCEMAIKHIKLKEGLEKAGLEFKK